MCAKQAGSLPVLIYHYVSNQPTRLAVSPELFEAHCRLLAEQGWKGVSLTEAEDFLLHGAALPARSFLLTLDDGYLDNYVNAWPILRKYGHKAVIFAVTDCINEASRRAADSTQSSRLTLDDLWSGRCQPDELPVLDAPVKLDSLGYPVRNDLFFTWEEARIMEKSGVITLAAHTTRHAGVFTSPAYSAFHRPGPDEIPLDSVVPGLPWGMPLFKTGPEVYSRAFVPSAELWAAVKAVVPQDYAAADAFLKEPGNLEKLRAVVGSFGDDLGRYESDEEMHARILGMLLSCRDVLQHELGHPVKSLCWPWGAFNGYAVQLAREAGFEVFFKVAPGPNPPHSATGVNRMNAKADAGKTLSRLRIYSKPFLGELYRRFRI